jgi:uncharacterized protein (DUF885 family)
MSRSVVLLALVSLACACSSLARLGIGQRLPDLDTRTRLANFLEEVHLARLDRSPETRTRLGLGDPNGLWDDRSDAYAREAEQLLRADLQRLDEDFEARRLSPAGQRWREAFARQTTVALEELEWRSHAYAVTHVHGPQVDVPTFLSEVQPLTSERDARVYVERLRAAGAVFERAAEALDAQRDAGVIAPRAVLAYARAQCVALLESDEPWLSALRAALAELELGARADGVLADAREALESGARPGVNALVSKLDAHLELASTELGVGRLPRGRAYYASVVARYGAPDWTPDDLHALGRREVQRVDDELLRVMQEVGFAGSVANFLAFLRDDPGHAWTGGDAAAEEWAHAAEVALGSVSARLSAIVAEPPATAIVVRTTAAPWPGLEGAVGYVAPTADPRSPGALVARPERVATLPRIVLEAQVHCAGLPGRHLMSARTRARLDLPKLLRYGSSPAHEGGWGLYAAALADALDPDQLPYARTGRLAQELWCAALLVVDTGLHTRRWERRQAVEYLLHNTCYPEALCDAAVLRCAAEPGRAVSAPLGLFTLRELRARAEATLLDKFDARDFHAAVLDVGPLPLDLLRAHLEEWTASRAR